MFVAVAVGGFLRALGRALAGQTSAARFSLSLVALWAVCTGTLVAIFASQEFLEGLFAAGHPVGLVGIFGYGGWWAVPAAACIGLVLATYFHGARWVVDAVARCHARRRGVTNRLSLEAAGAGAVLAAPPAPLVGGWSSRGPPGLS
jgi:hypothetical protein